MGIKDALASGAGKTAKFEQIGDSVEGTVVSAELKASTEPGGKPRLFPDGNPQFDFVFQIQTDQRDPDIQNDDGIRSVWMRSFGDDKKAILDAVTAAGDDDVNQGGWLKITLTGTVPAKTPGYAPRKIRSAEYRKPQGAVGQAVGAPPVQSNFSQPQQGQGQQAQQAQQAQPQQGQQWGQNPQQPQQGQQQGSPWGNQAPQNVQQGQPQPVQQGNPWNGQNQGQQGGDELSF